MKHTKKIIAVLLCVMSVMLCFAGCSSAGEAEEITSDTMLIAYTGDNSPFIYEENGEVKGFDVDLFEKIFKSIKGDYKNYEFVKVDEDYQLGEDVYCVDEDGNDCIAYVMVGGVQKNVSDINNTYSFTQDVINNRVVTITLDSYGVSSYTDLNGKAVGVVGDVAKSALDKNATIENGCKSVTEYTTDKISDAVADLNSGKINALVIDEFNLYTNVENVDTFKVLDGELENISYVYATEKYNGYVDSINEAIYELQSPDYNDADEFTPLVEQYFGYNASSFEYSPVEE